MRMTKWPYADYRWWVDSTTSAFLTISDLPEEYYHILREDPDPSGSGRLWDEGLALSHDEGTSPVLVAALLQLGSFRKWRCGYNDRAVLRKNEAIAGFIQRNTLAETMSPLPAFIEERMRRLLDLWLPDIGDIPVGKFGPGAVAEHWSHPMRFAHLMDWCSLPLHWPELPRGHCDMEHITCRLCAVPKTFATDRLITVEPCYNTFVQQIVRSMILESIHAGPLRGTCMDLGYTDGQSIQRRLALSASRTKRLATIDLSNASDSLTYEQIMRVMPAWLGRLLDVTRSQQFDAGDGCMRTLHLFAGMGNATTFPVETLFFSALVKAWALGNSRLNRFVSVFGDDVICANEVALELREQGFPCFDVNSSKSFIGSCGLRESCGIFAYNGEDITPVRIDGFLPSWEGSVGLSDVVRRLQLSKYPWAPLLEESIVAEGILPNWRRWVDSYPSFSSYYAPFDADPEARWNPAYQRLEWRLPRRVASLKNYGGAFGHRSDSVWLNAWFTGQLHTTYRRGRIQVNFPTGRYTFRDSWYGV